MGMTKPLNLVILTSDEMRGDCLAANGLNPDIATPNLDRLAGQGTLFARHFTNYPKCVPSRISMHTGRYCHTDGYRTITQHLPNDIPDILSRCKDAGYDCAVFGKNHLWEIFMAIIRLAADLCIITVGMMNIGHLSPLIGVSRKLRLLSILLFRLRASFVWGILAKVPAIF